MQLNRVLGVALFVWAVTAGSSLPQVSNNPFQCSTPIARSLSLLEQGYEAMAPGPWTYDETTHYSTRGRTVFGFVPSRLTMKYNEEYDDYWLEAVVSQPRAEVTRAALRHFGLSSCTNPDTTRACVIDDPRSTNLLRLSSVPEGTLVKCELDYRPL